MKQYIFSSIKSLSEEPLNVRIFVASDPNTRANILAKLAEDPELIVRYLVSKNPNTPEGAITEKFPIMEDDMSFDLALDFCVVHSPSDEEIEQVKSKARSIVTSYGYDCTDVSWSDRAEVARLNGEDDIADDLEGAITLYVSFNGYDDDKYTYSEAVRQALCQLIMDCGYGLEYSEFF